MLRLIVILAAISALAVFVRLLLVRSRVQARQQDDSASKIVTMPSAGPIAIKHYFFANLDHLAGPADPQNFYENLVVHVGPENADRYRVFSLWVTTPGAVRPAPEGYRFGRGLLIVESYDLELILRAVRQHINELGLLAEEVD
jgi:hypothetical protein